jgi:hypothetical protein
VVGPRLCIWDLSLGLRHGIAKGCRYLRDRSLAMLIPLSRRDDSFGELLDEILGSLVGPLGFGEEQRCILWERVENSPKTVSR